MDELWQRYRSFWTPVLIGLGVFLVGLIVVHVMTDDPEDWNRRVEAEKSSLKRKQEPSNEKIKNAKANKVVLEERVLDWAKRLDQAELAQPNEKVVDAVVTDALISSILRGIDPDVLRGAVADPETPASKRILAPFDEDSTAAGMALTRYEEIRQKRLNLLLTGDPNVGFSRLLYDVWSEFKVRANRADVELKSDVLGFGGITSVTRAVLAQRLLNLALLSRIVDLSIRQGAQAILEVRLEQRNNPLGDDIFLREWPFTVTLRGDIDAVRPVIELLTDPERPIALSHLALTQPPRSKPEEGQVQLQATAASVLVRPAASLDLDTE